jgi:error-prone DNA polymerase
MLADYGTTGVTVGTHPIALLRERMPALRPTARSASGLAGTGGAGVVPLVSSGDLDRLQHGTRVKTGGLVVARQRPGTANGIVFVLLEDEFGTINLIVPPKVYERYRLTVRTEPLMLVEGKLEKFAAAGGVINVMVNTIGQITAPDRPLAEIKDFSMLDEQVRLGLAAQRAEAAKVAASEEADDFRAVAPPVMSFASGRRR